MHQWIRGTTAVIIPFCVSLSWEIKWFVYCAHAYACTVTNKSKNKKTWRRYRERQIERSQMKSAYVCAQCSRHGVFLPFFSFTAACLFWTNAALCVRSPSMTCPWAALVLYMQIAFLYIIFIYYLLYLIHHSVDETLRLVKAFQYTDVHGEVCPANWTPGSKTVRNDVKNGDDVVWRHNDGRCRGLSCQLDPRLQDGKERSWV